MPSKPARIDLTWIQNGHTTAEHEEAATLTDIDAEPLRNLLQGHALGFDHHRFYPDQLQNHHSGEEREHVARREGAYQFRKQRGQQRGEYPVRETSERLALGPVLSGKYLGN